MSVLPLALAAVVALAATPLLAAAARRLGWVDRRDGALAERKPRAAPVPPVGGVALAAALAAAEPLAGPLAGGGLPWPALLAALALGTLDDLRRGGLGPAAKLLGQLAVGALLAAGAQGGVAERAGWVLVAVVAMNAVNTFDNADGAAAGLGLAALGGASAPTGALLGFLPWNLARGGAGGERVPRAYLGDAGSHLLGVLIAATPSAWPCLALPLADLARLAVVRLRRGRPPWSGDRLHLAHRLEAAGWPAPAGAVLLALLAALPRAGRALAGGAGLAAGLLATLAALVLAVARTPEPLAACPRSGAAR